MRVLIFLAIFLTSIAWGQLPYTWTPGVNPGWTSVNSGAGGALNWQPGCNVVTINCATYGTGPFTGGGYSNNALSTYTSPVIIATCTNASTIAITFRASGNIEYLYDFLFVEYSTNGGATWINPYGAGVGWTGNFGFPPGTTIPPIIAPASNNFRFRFTFDSDFSINYNGVSLLDFDIVCNPVLPVELVDFYGEADGGRNVIHWATMSEINNDYFTVLKSDDAINWKTMSEVDGAGNSNNMIQYECNDNSPNKGITYYKVEQTDFDGTTKIYGPIAITNDTENRVIIRIFDVQGRDYGKTLPNENGIFFIKYEDGSVDKVGQIGH